MTPSTTAHSGSPAPTSAIHIPRRVFEYYNSVAGSRGWQPLTVRDDFCATRFSDLAHSEALKPYPELRDALGTAAIILRSGICVVSPKSA
jgi:hypothetical protein